MNVASRAARRSDLAAIERLLNDAAEALSSERGGLMFLAREMAARPDLWGAVSRHMGRLDRLVAVGTVDDVVLGLALARIEVLGARSRTDRLARLEFLWVDPEARSVGLGEKLAHRVANWAADQGAAGLDAHALPGNRDAKNFLEAAGYSARLIVMHKRLPDLD